MSYLQTMRIVFFIVLSLGLVLSCKSPPENISIIGDWWTINEEGEYSEISINDTFLYMFDEIASPLPIGACWIEDNILYFDTSKNDYGLRDTSIHEIYFEIIDTNMVRQKFSYTDYDGSAIDVIKVLFRIDTTEFTFSDVQNWRAYSDSINGDGETPLEVQNLTMAFWQRAAEAKQSQE